MQALSTIHHQIQVDPGESLRIAGDVYRFTGAKQWAIATRFLTSLQKSEDHTPGHYPVAFTSADWNFSRLDFRSFLEKYIERQPALRSLRHHRYEPQARFKVELLTPEEKCPAP